MLVTIQQWLRAHALLNLVATTQTRVLATIFPGDFPLSISRYHGEAATTSVFAALGVICSLANREDPVNLFSVWR